MIKIGHRGARGYKPENTLASFEKALAIGVDMVEFDVHTCASGELVVIHDETVDRTTNGHGPVANLTLDQLQKLDAGEGEKIPTMAEVLHLVYPDVKINIELKGLGTAEPVITYLYSFLKQNGGSLDDFCISSFDHGQLLHTRSLNNTIPIGILYSGKPSGYEKLAEQCSASSINLSYRSLSQRTIDDIHRHNMQVFVYTVNEPEDIARATALGVDGIFSDFPDRLLVR